MKKSAQNRKRRYMILAICFMIAVIVPGLILTQPRSIENGRNADSAASELVNGIASGNGASAARGGGQLAGAMLADLKTVLIIFLVIITVGTVLNIVYRIYRAGHRNYFTEEDEDDDYWNA